MRAKRTKRKRKPIIMKVKDLIKILKECDQDLPVFVYADSEIYEIDLVDESISDRVDLNIQINDQ